MPSRAFDGFTITDKAILIDEIKQLVSEASKKIGAKIEKVQQPESDEVLFQLHCASGRKKLLICLAPNGCRLHFTELTYENPVGKFKINRTASIIYFS